MKQDHPAFLINIEKHPCNSVLRQTGAHLIDAVMEWPANGHPDRPTELHRFDIFSDAFAVIRRKLPQPLPYGLATRLRSIKDGWDPLTLLLEVLHGAPEGCGLSLT